MFPLWELVKGSYMNRDPMSLSLSVPLHSRLTHWRATFESTYDACAPERSGFATPKEAAAFEVEGRSIAEGLRTELAPASVKYLLSARIRAANTRV